MESLHHALVEASSCFLELVFFSKTCMHLLKLAISHFKNEEDTEEVSEKSDRTVDKAKLPSKFCLLRVYQAGVCE